jgi:predicted glycoside hydrolase/deacetylase ChbG (UPF0249 family)
MIRLVVNADDLGLHPRIDEGILRAHREGILTSATVLATGRNAERAVAQAKAQGLAVGLHLCLTTGLEPAAGAANVPSLAPGGRFRRAWPQLVTAWATGVIHLGEVEREFTAQLDRLRALGAEPDHLDGHQHLHLLPGISRAVEVLAARNHLPVRWPSELPRRSWLSHPGAGAKSALLTALGRATPPRGALRVKALGIAASGCLNEATLLELLDSLAEGDAEIGCHPGLSPGSVPEDPDWRYGWETELAALCSPRVRDRLAERGIILTTYGELAARG